MAGRLLRAAARHVVEESGPTKLSSRGPAKGAAGRSSALRRGRSAGTHDSAERQEAEKGPGSTSSGEAGTGAAREPERGPKAIRGDEARAEKASGPAGGGLGADGTRVCAGREELGEWREPLGSAPGDTWAGAAAMKSSVRPASGGDGRGLALEDALLGRRWGTRSGGAGRREVADEVDSESASGSESEDEAESSALQASAQWHPQLSLSTARTPRHRGTALVGARGSDALPLGRMRIQAGRAKDGVPELRPAAMPASKQCDGLNTRPSSERQGRHLAPGSQRGFAAEALANLATRAPQAAVPGDALEKGLLVPALDPRRGGRAQKQSQSPTTGPKWYHLPAATITPELKQELRLLKLRGVMDPKRHYRAPDSSKFPKHFQIGTVVEGAADFFSGRLTNKERHESFGKELLHDSSLTSYRKRKYQKIQEDADKAGKGRIRRKEAKAKPIWARAKV